MNRNDYIQLTNNAFSRLEQRAEEAWSNSDEPHTLSSLNYASGLTRALEIVAEAMEFPRSTVTYWDTRRGEISAAIAAKLISNAERARTIDAGRTTLTRCSHVRAGEPVYGTMCRDCVHAYITQTDPPPAAPRTWPRETVHIGNDDVKGNWGAEPTPPAECLCDAPCRCFGPQFANHCSACK